MSVSMCDCPVYEGPHDPSMRCVERLDAQIEVLRADLDIAESRKAEAFQRLRAERDAAESERARLASLLSSVARTHGCPEGIQKRIRAEGVTQDPSAEWSPYRLRRERDAARAALGCIEVLLTLASDELPVGVPADETARGVESLRQDRNRLQHVLELLVDAAGPQPALEARARSAIDDSRRSRWQP